MSLMGLQEKRVVILGGTSGIGFATAQAAAREGASIVIASSRKERVDRAIAALPEGTEGYVVDLSREEEIRDCFAYVGEFDHLVFTAGESLHLSDISGTEIEKAKQAFQIRFWGAYAVAKYGKDHIRPGGSIVLTTGIAGERPHKGWTVASSICGAMVSLTRALAVELAPIRVNIVSPGIVRTDLWSGMVEADREAMYQGMAETLPVGHIGEAEDIAEAYLYLMRERFSTGQTVVVDGGGLLV